MTRKTIIRLLLKRGYKTLSSVEGKRHQLLSPQYALAFLIEFIVILPVVAKVVFLVAANVAKTFFLLREVIVVKVALFTVAKVAFFRVWPKKST